MVESPAPPERQLRAVLVSMPWATIVRPSLAVGILARICEEEDVEVLSLHANLDMAARIGTEAAAILSDERMLYGLADHFFACDLYGTDTLDSNQFVKVLGSLNPPGIFRRKEYVRQLRDQIVPAYLDEMTERVLAHNPNFVGFSATFNQVMGSLALAARIKKARPEVIVIAGGACFDGEMGQEYHRALPDALDHVFMGEAEESFREFLRRLQSGDSTDAIPGVTWREGSEIRLEPGSPLADMSASPAPTYDDYFRQRRELQQTRGLAFQVESLPFESSRGCWWGQNSHCVFCGINDDVMPFREKTVDRVIEEMVGLASRYRVTKLTAADWIISKRQRKEIFQRLADLNYDIDCFYETRVDLPKDEVALMKAAGVTSIQPGIESLSTELLHHMGKGTSRIRVVQFLRWAKEYGIHLSYNILGGFPGEQAEWYLEMADFIPTVIHLQPPVYNLNYVEMHRFSPLFERREAFGVTDFEIRPDYLFNFPEGSVDLKKVGYFFNYRSSTLADPRLYDERVRKALAAWISMHESDAPPTFEYRIGAGFTRVTDTRAGTARFVDLDGLPQDIVLLCDEAQNPARLKSALAAKYPAEVETGAVEAVVDELVSGGILLREGPLVLTLPIGHRARTTAELREHVFRGGGGDSPDDIELAVPMVAD